jgi:hypothetical protein
MTDRSRSPDLRDDLATLVKLGGPRAAPPASRAARVKAALHTHWRSEVRRRTRRRNTWLFAAMAAASAVIAAVALDIPSRFVGTPPVATAAFRVESVVQPVWVRDAAAPGAQPARLEVGNAIPVASELATEGDGRIAVRSESGHSVRLDVSTRVRIVSPVAVALDRGKIYVDSGIRPDRTGAPLEIHTPFGIVREMGTQFEVRVRDDAVRIRVREGSVQMDADRGTYSVAVGTEFELDDRGVPNWSDAPPHGSEWDWLSSIAPVFDLEGSSARAFLEWVSRERGWTLRFADEQVGRSAAEIVLRGSIEGLTLDQALDAVLPTCQMVHRVENGTLVVEAATEGGTSG